MGRHNKDAPSCAITPPATPTSPAQFKSGSTSNDCGTQTSLARQASAVSTAFVPRSPSIHSHPVPPQLFDHEILEYVILVDKEDKKRPIGSGVWSDVYLAVPSIPKPVDRSHSMLPSAAKSLPVTLIKSNDSAIGLYAFPATPSLYAIKAPASTSSRRVLREEAKILSYLSQFPDSDDHIVQFFGQDLRNEALVLKAMDGTLEDWIKNNLNNLSDDLRAAKLAAVFPRIGISLIHSLMWMQDKNCVHADIKPSNILTTETPMDPTSVPETVYSDFSSTILIAPEIEVHNASPLGAGTWDYLDPSLLRSTDAPEASAATDLWSLAITLLFLIIGASPFDGFRHNKFQQREMIKSGQPLQCLAYDDIGIENVRKMKDLSKALGLDLHKWFARVLVKDVSKRIDVAEWRDELARVTTRAESM
ncbi:kinase-like protein [Didymella exigua CBS 183.55]|uniref:non-specific serine/threonine protein kinase n=1 Tax=Didymella exigua CBS 183.55 TaxID=1150837 RepID=A0A6A5RWA3_9PLEO|nr:kinase-like protein [Didymella exigua CBS 183.55]KAF1931278.1 kinase-like protein [Didymella exigua CBS 183.55]